MGLKDDFAASFVIQDLFYLGETRSAEDFGIFHRMPPERLCLGCGVRSDETFSPLPPHDRSGLHKAAVRLMCLVLSEVPLPDKTEDERLVKVALTPLVRNRDGHFLATLSALKLLLLEGKTDCPISGVLGAGKTRAAAATVAGLSTVRSPRRMWLHKPLRTALSG